VAGLLGRRRRWPLAIKNERGSAGPGFEKVQAGLAPALPGVEVDLLCDDIITVSAGFQDQFNRTVEVAGLKRRPRVCNVGPTATSSLAACPKPPVGRVGSGVEVL
jgi:hypothetical protein